jgi:hypothetical protein
MKRHLLNLLTALSLLLCVAVVALWVRSLFVTDVFLRWTYHYDGGAMVWNQETVAVGRGGVGFCRIAQFGYHSPEEVRAVTGRHGPPFHSVLPPAYPDFRLRPARERGAFGLKVARMDTGVWGSGPAISAVAIVLPLWSVSLPLAVLPVLWGVRRWRARKAARPGRCPSCGYDLRATPGRCPECGTLLPSASQLSDISSARGSTDRY